jgi:hypothetical protein
VEVNFKQLNDDKEVSDVPVEFKHQNDDQDISDIQVNFKQQNGDQEIKLYHSISNNKTTIWISKKVQLKFNPQNDDK